MTHEIMVQKYKKLIPKAIYRAFGCSNCNNRDDCEHNDGNVLNMPPEEICDKQISFIISLLPISDYVKKPSVNKIMLDLAKSIAHQEQVGDWMEVEKIKKYLSLAKTPEEIARYKKELDYARNWLNQTNKRVLEYTDRQETRDEGVTIHQGRPPVTPNDIYEMRKKARGVDSAEKVVDADFEDENGKTKDDGRVE